MGRRDRAGLFSPPKSTHRASLLLRPVRPPLPPHYLLGLPKWKAMTGPQLRQWRPVPVLASPGSWLSRLRAFVLHAAEP